jgi:outer membrane protein assembly factor BamB
MGCACATGIRCDRGPAASGSTAGLALALYTPARWLYLLGPETGRVRWSAGTFVAQGVPPLVTGTAVIAVEGQDRIAVTARDAASGRVRWQVPLAGVSAVAAVTQAGPLALVPAVPLRSAPSSWLLAYQMTSGHLAWRVRRPAFLQLAPVAVPGGDLLVQTGDPAQACLFAALRTSAGRTTAGRA